jgi:hypothetical protein
MTNDSTNPTKSYSGYKKVQVTTEWTKTVAYVSGKNRIVWLHPWTNEVVWLCPPPLPTIHSRWESTAQIVKNAPQPMRTKKTITEDDPNKFKR